MQYRVVWEIDLDAESFEDAARRTAQMHYDLGFDGAAVFYSSLDRNAHVNSSLRAASG